MIKDRMYCRLKEVGKRNMGMYKIVVFKFPTSGQAGLTYKGSFRAGIR